MLNRSCPQHSSVRPGSDTQVNDSCETQCLDSSTRTSSSSHFPIDSDSLEVFAAGPMVQETEDVHGTATLRCRASNSDLSHEGCAGQGTFPSDSYHLCLETPQQLEPTHDGDGDQIRKLAKAVRTILECVGEDPEREGLRDTPERYAKALLYFTKGYSENAQSLVNSAVFRENYDGLIIVRDIGVFSLCEHHMVPFTGKMHIGYIPDGRILGLSKVARLVEMFSRRLQIQERLTKQVAMAIFDVLKPRGVGVIMESSHLCMVMRGVEKIGSTTSTSYMVGCMRSSAKTRDEFFALLRRG
ncbi:hypothetical protein FQN51_005923 [Onygenales sp. PD_10]|nr:hypothetical protein FQN51_005923 [Onygenales sp. PD_10]